MKGGIRETRFAMQKELTANRIGGRAVGALFFAGFGVLWLVLGLYAKERLTLGPVAMVVCGAAVLSAGALALLRRAKEFPREEDNPAMARAFKWINIVQWVAVGVVAFAFSRFGIDAYVMSAITAIVGLHMFPLARLFRYPMHYATGAVLVAWAAASVFLFSVNSMQGSTALGTGTILWLSALITLGLGMRAMRKGAYAALPS